MGDTIKAMTEAVRGCVVTPSDSDYDDDRRPRAIIRCMDSADVMAAVAGWPDARWRHRLPDPLRRVVHRQPALG